MAAGDGFGGKAEWKSKLGDVVQRQLTYATARAINQVLDLAQLRQRAEDAKRFTFGRASARAFFDRAVTIRSGDRAKKDNLTGVIRIAGPQSDPERGNIIARFETGGFDEPFRGQSVALPGRDLLAVGRGKSVAPADRLSNFGPFVQSTRRWEVRVSGRSRSVGLAERLVGKQDTWLVTLRRGQAAGRRAVLQRKNGQLRLLYLFVPHTRRPDLIDFGDTVQAVATKAWPIAFRGEFAAALASAKWGNGRTGAVTT